MGSREQKEKEMRKKKNKNKTYILKVAIFSKKKICLHLNESGHQEILVSDLLNNGS